MREVALWRACRVVCSIPIAFFVIKVVWAEYQGTSRLFRGGTLPLWEKSVTGVIFLFFTFAYAYGPFLLLYVSARKNDSANVLAVYLTGACMLFGVWLLSIVFQKALTWVLLFVPILFWVLALVTMVSASTSTKNK